MTKFLSLLSTAVLLTQPVFAADAGERREVARDAPNWDVFLKLYPKRALQAREEGVVGFIVTLDNKGEVAACRVTRSSGHPLLDSDTCNLIALHAQLKPDGNLSPSRTKTHEGMIAWRLPTDTAPIETPKRIAANATPERIVCKRTVRIGTLAGFERTCMTPTDWARQSDEMRQPWDEVQGRKGATREDMCQGTGC